jgi:hypothetical protein
MGLFFLFAAITPCSADEIKHVVKKGDTLWDISMKYLKTHWKWPLVWANNEDITNPHLIYPGDTVVITRDGDKTVIKIVPKGAVTEAAVYSPEQAAALEGKSIVLSPQYSTYIFSPNELTGSGKVVKKIEQGELASQDEHVFIRTNSEMKKGQGITIVSKEQDIKKDKATIGYLYKAVGIGFVKEVQANVAKVQISFILEEVRVGSIIFDDLAAVKPITLTVSEPKIDPPAKVIDLYGGVSGASDFDLIFMDAGKNQGIEKGAIVSVNEPAVFQEKNEQAVEFLENQGMAIVLQSLDSYSMALLLQTKERIDKGFVIKGKE